MNNNKRICSITTVDITMDPFILSQIDIMKSAGWDITIICNMRPDFIKRIPEGVHYYNVPMERSFNIWTAVKSTYKLFKIFNKEKYTIIQYAATHAALYSSVAGWFARIPIRIHLQWGIYNYSEMGLSGYFYKLVEWLTCKFSSVIRPVSHKNMQIAVSEGLFEPFKGKVLGEGGTVGVDLKEYPLENKGEIRKQIREKYNIPKSHYVFGFVGRISTAKGNNELIEAFRRFVQSHSDCTLLLVGEDEGSVDRTIMNWAISNSHVVVANRLPHDEIPKCMAAMDCLIHPTYREGFGMVLQEAMAMAVPIVTTDIPGPSEVIENNKTGILISPQSTMEILNAMDEVYNNREKYYLFGINGRKRVEKYFSREIMLEQLLNDKEDLLNQYFK